MFPLRIRQAWSTVLQKKTPLRWAVSQQTTAGTTGRSSARSSERDLPSVWYFRSQGSYQDNAKNKWVHLFFVLWLQKPFHHLPPAGPSGSWCRQKSKLCTAYSFCAPLPLPNPAFSSGNVNPPLLFGTPEVCSSLWSGLSGLTVAVESRMHSRLEIIWLQCFFSCIYNVTLQSLSPSSLIKPATLP